MDYAFENVSGHSTRPLYVYSDVNASTVLGDQITDFIREVNYKREGKGSYYFEPTQLQYISLRKQLLDIIQVQVPEGTGHLVQFGNGVTTATFHFKNERRFLPHTLPSNSSLTDYPNNSINNFKVRLPTPLQLQGNWKVALASISVPDPKSVLPSWLTDRLPLAYMTWYNADTSHLSKHYLEASFLLSDINENSVHMMTGTEFLKNVFHYFKRKYMLKMAGPTDNTEIRTPTKPIIQK